MTQSVPGAAPYTQDEITTTVQQLVQQSIQYPVDTLGVRRTDLTFDQFQQACASIFILFPDAPFYCLALGASRLMDQITQEAMTLDQLIAAVKALGVVTSPIDDVSSLFNAQAALQNLGAAAVSRSGTFQNIQQTSGFQQFVKSANAFLTGPGQNCVQQSQIVQTPAQARLQIPGLIQSLKQQHEQLIASVQLLAQGIENYNAVNLPSIVGSSVLSAAEQLIGQSAQSMQSQTPADRLQQVRQTVLNLIAAKTVVQQYCQLQPPTQFIAIQGQGLPYSDAQHLATPATAVSTASGAVAIIEGLTDQLEIQLDGGTPFTITMPPSQVAELDGQLAAPFLIGDGSSPVLPSPQVTPLNNVFALKVGSTVWTSTLTTGLTRTADSVALDIQVGMPSNVTAEAYYLPLYYQGGINIVSGTNPTWTLPGSPPVSDLLALGVVVGATVQVPDSPDQGIFVITAVTSSSITISGSIATSRPNAQVLIGAANRRVRVRINDPAVDVLAETQIQVLGSTPAEQGCCQALGFFPGAASQCLETTLDVLAQQIQASTPALKATPQIQLVLQDQQAHTNVLDGHAVVLANTAVQGTQSFAGTTLTYTVTSIQSPGALTTGDTLALRTGPGTGQGYVVQQINGAPATLHALAVGDVIVAVGSSTSTPATQVQAETGPTVTVIRYDVLVIQQGANQGSYLIASQGPTALDIELIAGLVSFMTPSLQPAALQVGLGQQYLALTSLDQTTLSSVQVQGSGGPVLFGTVPFMAGGTTPWFELPVLPQALQAGDLLYTYATQYNEPSAIYLIEAVDQGVGTGVIELQPDIPSGQAWQFGGQVPYAALVQGVNNDYQVVQGGWVGWLASPPQQPSYWLALNAQVNQLLASDPAAQQRIGQVVSTLDLLYGELQSNEATQLGQDPATALDQITASLTVEPVPAIDTLVTAYLAKGADLAVDTLLSGDFSGFFGLTAQGSSYAGAMQAAIIAVAQNDLPVRKINRANTTTGRVISTSSTPDPEYTVNNVNEQLQQEQVNPPASLGSGQPSNQGTTIGMPGTAQSQTNNRPT